MSNNTLTLVLDGDTVPLDAFEQGISNFRRLLEALSSEVSRGADVQWVIDHLEFGSAVLRVRAESPRAEDVAAVLEAYLQVGRALQTHGTMSFSQSVKKPAYALADIINGRVTSLRFETAEDEVIIGKQQGSAPDASTPRRAFGAVTGRIQTLSSRRGYTFTLYDAMFDKAVTCYLRADQGDLLRDKWDRRAVVEGIVSRDRETDRPLTVRGITDIVVVPEYAGGVYLPTLSDLPAQGDEEDTDALIRRLRDAW